MSLFLVPPYAGVVEVVLGLQTKTVESLLIVCTVDLNLVRRIRHAANDARTPVAHRAEVGLQMSLLLQYGIARTTPVGIGLILVEEAVKPILGIDLLISLSCIVGVT